MIEDDGSLYEVSAENAARVLRNTGYGELAQFVQPQKPSPKLSVWYGPMPESNGKTNWTAILHRGDITSGITIERSEYPDRVRYHADCVRYLIGELKAEPNILDYDAEKHSGYREPKSAIAALTEDVEAACTLLEEREYTEHWAKTELGKRLEAALTNLHSETVQEDEPVVIQCGVRDGEDDLHLECRMSDGQKGAFVKVDREFPELANRISKFLSSSNLGRTGGTND
jgi:hypothetical protein